MPTPTTVVLFGATGDLAQRKLLPGLLHLFESGLLHRGAGRRHLAGRARPRLLRRVRPQGDRGVRRRGTRPRGLAGVLQAAALGTRVPAAPRRCAATVADAEAEFGTDELRRLHYLSVPPKAALAVVHLLGDADLVERSRIIMEKPFGTDLASRAEAQRRAARGLRRGADLPDRPLPGQGGGAEHPGLPLRQRALRADLAPQPHRPRPDRRARGARPGPARRLLRVDRRLPRHGGHPPVPGARVHRDGAADGAGAATRSARRRTRSSGRCCRSSRSDVVRGQYVGYRDIEGVAPDSETETFIALKCYVDNWRWAGVPFYLRTGKRMAEGARIISIAFREPPALDVPAGLRRRRQRPGPPHLRPRRPVEDVAVLLRQAPRPGHAAATSSRCSSPCTRPAGRAPCSRPTSG